MVRTRRSLAGGATKTAEDSAPVSKDSSVPIAKRARGRPSKASLAAAAAAANRESPSSVATSTSKSADSISGSSTPLTSNVTTPAPSLLMDKTKQPLPRSLRSSKLEVVIPMHKTHSSAADNIQKAKEYMMGNHSTTSKRKRDIIADSDNDDLSDSYPDPGRTRHDEKIARQLQEELDREAAETMDAQDASVTDNDDNDDDDDAQQYTMATSDSEDYPLADRKGKGNAVATRPYRRASRAAAQSHVVPDSDEDDDSDFSDSGDIKPPAKKQKILVKGRGKQGSAKGKQPAAALAESDYDVSVPAKRATRQKKAGRGGGRARDVLDLPSDTDFGMSDFDTLVSSENDESGDDNDAGGPSTAASGSTRAHAISRSRRAYRAYASRKRVKAHRTKLEEYHPQLKTMWDELQKMDVVKAGKSDQPKSISRLLKPFQLEGLAWMKAMEQTKWKGGLLGDEMGLGKTIQAVSLIMSDYPAKQPSLVLVPPVALMQWVSEIESYTDGTLKTLVYHGTNSQAKRKTVKDLKKYDVIIMSYNSLESIYRKQEKGFKRKDGIHKEKSVIHATHFHRVILDEAHCIKTRSTMTAKACFALDVDYRWCLTGTPLQNRIGEFFSLIRFLNVRPFASYFCKGCPCESLEWVMDEQHNCTGCGHNGMQHISVFNQELLNPIQRYGNRGEGAEAFRKLRLMTDRLMLRRLKKDHTNSMELPVKEIYVDRQFFGRAENDFANSIMTNGQREFDTYVAHGVLLNNYANIFGLIMQMRQVADHPDLILKKDAEGGQNVLVCCICDEPAEEAIRSRCKHDFCRSCAKSYLGSQDQPDCPQCHIPLSIDLEQPEIEQDEAMVKKSSIINRINMKNWTSSSKIELLVHELHRLRSDKASHKSIIFSQFTTMLQLIEWRLRRAGITTVMLDGSMTPAQRAASIDHFMKNVEVECFLVSLKAGGVALNLTEASRVFIVDPWWNPAAEWQSADRCHRIGQTRPCTITRLCIEDSVESRMVLLQEKKANMINSTINSDDAAMESLSPEDLQFLFRGN
ncbi:DNA repair protein RAD16 [Cytospora mali]|uniref:DNA repair protein RAD16 n=1 Tax=Cytospora mali TaxID=578113 RepID=A0A194VAA6_CYTMA|nr:DNA repair protein RAD16 [Valsa mali var. pyri (nom. inval.)]